jgi:four helix bundle protein
MNAKTKSFKELEAWKKSHEFVLLVYKISEKFPRTEVFGLTSQFRRAAISIAANIAEGYRKHGKPDKLRFYNIAQGSQEECSYYVILSKDLQYISPLEYENLSELLNNASKLLNNYYMAILDSKKTANN